MRYHELMGLLDDTFAKYRKEENSPDSKWTPYCYYKNLDDVKNDYSVYVRFDENNRPIFSVPEDVLKMYI